MESPMNNAMMRLMVLLTKSNLYCYLDNLTDAVDWGIYGDYADSGENNKDYADSKKNNMESTATVILPNEAT